MDHKKGKGDKWRHIKEKSRRRIQEGRDPKVVRWHAALESMFMTMEDRVIPGEIITIDALNPKEIESFRKLHLNMDLAPFVTAVFLPASIADPLSRSSANRIERELKGSNKVLVAKYKDYKRILTAEISPAKPGIDIFDEGSHVGSHNYYSVEECISDLSNIIWIHMKHEDRWTDEDYIKYTEGWFYRSATHKVIDLPINANYSYIHHPGLLNMDEVAAVYKLMKAVLLRIHNDPNEAIAFANSFNQSNDKICRITKQGLVRGDKDELKFFKIYMEDKLIQLLKLLRGYEVIDFGKFTPARQKKFKAMFPATVDDVIQKILKSLKDRI